ncbi:MAG TPA: hypothetical protein VMS12_02790, partial [Thermoanaerobaculia bacterium]|nr:hypothetical protein [Thermoanaerobaculia bacterium]
DLHSIGRENFDWVVKNMADVLIENVHRPRQIEITGNWPAVMQGEPSDKKATSAKRPSPTHQPKPKPKSAAPAPARKPARRPEK